jgi:hypothetical protein
MVWGNVILQKAAGRRFEPFICRKQVRIITATPCCWVQVHGITDTMCCWVQVQGSATRTDRQCEYFGLEKEKNIVNRMVGFRTHNFVRQWNSLFYRRTVHNNREGNQNSLRKILFLITTFSGTDKQPCVQACESLSWRELKIITKLHSKYLTYPEVIYFYSRTRSWVKISNKILHVHNTVSAQLKGTRITIQCTCYVYIMKRRFHLLFQIFPFKGVIV